MKILLILPLALLTGCCGPVQTYPVQGTGYGSPFWCSAQSVLNNSGCVLDVFQDGALVCQNLGLGQVYRLHTGFLQRGMAVAVVGRTPDGSYVGCDNFIFDATVPETWTVSRLYAPKSPQ